MPKQTLQDVDVQGLRVLVRVDFNVPMEDGQISDDNRIRAALPTIHYLRERNARVILCSHLGRPNGKVDESARLAPIAEGLEAVLGAPVNYATECIGPVAEADVAAMEPGEVLLLENLRFHAGEEKNDPAFAAQLAQLGGPLRERRLWHGAPGARVDGGGRGVPARSQRLPHGAGAHDARQRAGEPEAPAGGDHGRREGVGQDRRAGDAAGPRRRAGHRRGHGGDVHQGDGPRRRRLVARRGARRLCAGNDGAVRDGRASTSSCRRTWWSPTPSASTRRRRWWRPRPSRTAGASWTSAQARSGTLRRRSARAAPSCGTAPWASSSGTRFHTAHAPSARLWRRWRMLLPLSAAGPPQRP